MNRIMTKDWEDAQSVAQAHGVCAVAKAAIAFDWDSGDMRVLGRLMSKLGLDLATAVQAFLNGRPHDYNHIAKDDVPLKDSARCNMLDCLHSKISCGFYLPDPNVGLGPVRAEAEAWIAAQSRDRAKGHIGRWVFDEAKFRAISDTGPRTLVMTPTNDTRPAFLRALLEPIWM